MAAFLYLIVVVTSVRLSGMIKDFLMKQMLKRQGVPEDQIDMVLSIVNKNPDLFKKIATEVQEKIKGGKEQMAATMEVMEKYQKELEALKASK